MQSQNQTFNIFISYAQEDEQAKNELSKHLESMRKEELIASWDKQQIIAGVNWQEKVKKQLEKAQIILLLISSDAIASEYVFNNEIQNAVERHQEGTAIVIPVLLRACDWTLLKEKGLVALPYMDTETAVSSWKNKDEAYHHIAQNLRLTVGHFPEILEGKNMKHIWTKANEAQLKEDSSKPSIIPLIAVICSIVIAGIALLNFLGVTPSFTPSQFTQTVLLRKGTAPFQQEGRLTLTYGKEQESLPIGNGKLSFPIENYQEETAYFALEGIDDYELLYPDSAYLLGDKKPITLQLVVNKALLTFKGRVRDKKTASGIPNVTIIVENERFLTDSLGFFNKTLSFDKPKNSYQLFAEKEGYETHSEFYNPQSTPANIRLKKLNN